MKQKTDKIYAIGLAVMLFSSMVSCKNEVDDVFDEQPSIRIQHYIDNCQQVLASSPNGWVAAFYGNAEYGGYNLLCKFDGKESVVVANERFKSDTTAVTHYKLEQSNGIVLSFDEYCPLVHYFSDPSTLGFGKKGRAFEGDLEFRVITATTDSIVMVGKKHGRKLVMQPMPDNMTWYSYLAKVHDVEDEMFSLNYELVAGKDTVQLKKNRMYRCFSYKKTNEEGDQVQVDVPYVVTPQGYSLYDVFTLGNRRISNFAYSANSESYVQDNDVKITKKISPLNEQLVTGIWTIAYSKLGSLGKATWTIARNNLSRNGQSANLGPLEIDYASLGYEGTDFGLTFAIGNATLGYYFTQLYFAYELKGTDEITMQYDNRCDEGGNGQIFMSYGLSACLNAFGAAGTPRTFKLSTDNPANPSYITMTDLNASNNVITVLADDQDKPFEH